MQRIDAGGALGATDADAEPLPFTDVVPGHVHEERDAPLANDEGAARGLDALGPRRQVEAGRDADRSRAVGQPEGEVEHGIAEVEHGAAAGLLAAEPPAELGPARPEGVPAAADAGDAAQLPALDEAPHDLDVGPVAVGGGRHEHAIPLLRGLDDLERGGGGGRQRSLDHDVEAGRERGDRVGFVEVVRGADQDRVDLAEAEHLFDVVDRDRDLVAIGQRPRLGQVVVADHGDLDTLELAQDRQVGHLGDRSGTDDSDAHWIRHAASRPQYSR